MRVSARVGGPFVWAICAAAAWLPGAAHAAFDLIPRPLSASIDDVGWQGGSDLSAGGGPFRMGSRDPTLADYQELARIAQNAGTRLLTLWILSELDRSNICAKAEYNMPAGPSNVTEAGLAWDNSAHVSDEDFTLMQFVRQNAAWLEFGLHGVRHEHWEGPTYQRAEFAKSGGTTWGWAVMVMHLDCFVELMRQYYTVEECSFPRSFVPPAHCYYYEASSAETTGAAVHSYGVKYVQRPCTDHFDNGALCVDRDGSASPAWYAEGVVAGAYPAAESWVMTHAPNYFGKEAEWSAWLDGVNDAPDRYLPKNTAQAYSQHLYRQYATISDVAGVVTIDTTGMPDEAYVHDLLGTLVLKTALGGQHVASARIDNGAQVVATWEDAYGYGYLLIGHSSNAMGRLAKEVYTLTYALGPETMSDCVDLAGRTCNVFSFNLTASTATISVEMYGAQDVAVRLSTFVPGSVTSDSPGLIVDSWGWDAPSRTLTVSLTGTDMQGETGTIAIGPEAGRGRGYHEGCCLPGGRSSGIVLWGLVALGLSARGRLRRAACARR